MDIDLEKNFQSALKKLAPQFGEGLDMQAVLFLIGVQELGKGFIKLTKEEKVDVLHVAICTLLAPYGFYEYEGLDKDGWPHWKANEKLPPLKSDQQQQLMKQAIIDYFNTKEMIN